MIAIVGSIHAIDIAAPKLLRARHVERARSIAMYVARHHTRESYVDLARAFHTRPDVVIGKVQHLADSLRDDLALRAHVHAIESALIRL